MKHYTASILGLLLYDVAKICREIPEVEALTQDTFIDEHDHLRWNDKLKRGHQVFLAGLDGTTGIT